MLDNLRTPLNKDPGHHRTPGVEPDLPSPVPNWADHVAQEMVGLLRMYAKHLGEHGSFVSDKNWWKENWGTPQCHVRLTSQAPIIFHYALTPSCRCFNTSSIEE